MSEDVELEDPIRNEITPLTIDQVDLLDDTTKKEAEEETSASLTSSSRPVDNADSQLSTTDICRICHMGGFPVLTAPRPMWEWPKHIAATRVDSQISTLSSYAYLGPLISACKCRGTVALVHVECLERWLTESGHSRCELCGHRYITRRVPRHGLAESVWIWFKTVIATRQMLLDVLYLIVTTPLALFSIYICAVALRMILDNGFYQVPWMIVAMLPTCSLTLVAYWSWIITLGRYISRRWRRFWRNNFVVRLLPDVPTIEAQENPIFEANNGLFDDHPEPEDFQDLLHVAF